MLGEPVESGLIVMMNGETRDVVAPIVNKSVVRTCAGVELDFSRMDVIRRRSKKTEERLRWKPTIWEVAAAEAKGVVPIRWVAYGETIEFDPTSEPVAAVVPPREDGANQQVIEGIDVDVSAVASAVDRAMIEAEIAEVGDSVRDFVNWYSDLSKAFPRASFEIATKDWNDEPKVERASNGKIDYSNSKSSPADQKKAHARVVREDKRAGAASIDTKRLPQSYVRFATARKAWRASWKEGLDVGDLMGLLGDPAFSPTEPSSLVRLATAERIRMYELVVHSTPSNKPPTREIVAAIERESADVHWRITGAWSHHERGRQALMNAALAVESPILKDRLRGASGYGTLERTGVLARALALATKPAPTNVTEISVQIDRALSDAKERLERHQKTKLPNATEAIAAADEASKNRDVNAMLKALDDDGLWSNTAAQRREWLWSEIIRTPRKFLSFERVLRALSEERDKCAHRITYKLYVQTHFAKKLASAVEDLETRKPEGSDLLLRRLKNAIADWPDFPTT